MPKALEVTNVSCEWALLQGFGGFLPRRGSFHLGLRLETASQYDTLPNGRVTQLVHKPLLHLSYLQ
jgi:hypothetical protein